jgi:hypothetical protein
MSVDGLLERMAQVLRSAPAVPLSASCVVQRAEMLALIEEARADLPAELDEAHQLLRRRQDVLAEARVEAESLLTAAHRRAESLVASDAVINRAQARAHEMLTSAAREAAATQRQADDWCDRSLAGVEAELTRLLGQVHRGRAVLADRSGAGGPDSRTASEPVLDTVVDLRDGRPPSRWSRTRRPGAAGGGGAELGQSGDLQ